MSEHEALVLVNDHEGVRTLTLNRPHRRNALNGELVTTLKEHLEQAGADEGLMLDPQGFVNTTNACNFFIVRKGEVWTSTGDYCMNGVTRQKVIDICRTNNIPVFEKNYSLVETYGADEAFLTGTFGAQTPVTQIDGKKIGSHAGIGPMTAHIQALYRELIIENTQS